MDSTDEMVRKRKEKAYNFFKKRTEWITYGILAVITYLALRIRTSNIAGLRDVTTGNWTLGPDLDPFLFLRYAKEIISTGTLSLIDTMRYYPIGFNTHKGFLLHYYLIAWFHKFAQIFGSSSVDQSAAIYPVVAFGLTVIAFFFLVKEVFIKSQGAQRANAIALVASFFLSVMPALIPRTIAGIPEKESVAFLFLFLAFLFFIKSFNNKGRKGILYALLSGVSTASMALIWGGYAFIFLTISLAILIYFLFGNLNKENKINFAVWILSSFAIMNIFSLRYTVSKLVTGLGPLTGIAVLFVLVVDYLIYRTKIRDYLENGKLSKIPRKFKSLIIAITLVVILSSLFSGPQFIVSKVLDVYHGLVKPAVSRLIQTVAENRQPYFKEWASNFGPEINGIYVTFWLSLIGSVILFYNSFKFIGEKKVRNLSGLFLLFLAAIIFSRYSSSSILNGENFISTAFYFLGVLTFLIVGGNYILKSEAKWKVDLGLLILFIFFTFSIISARGFIRLVMVLVPPASMMIGYLSVESYHYFKDYKKSKKLLGMFITGLILFMTIFSGWVLYNSDVQNYSNYVPGVYNQQWQRAMSWVRESTPVDSVFGHWWDYGYWVQSIGERATILDGGNSVSYWNHLMGRYVLTSPSKEDALEFLYSHNGTHLLIDSTDLGKYSAFSSIGSDVNYDRRSWIPTFLKDNSQTLERKNETVFVYTGGSSIDEDIIYQDNSSKIFLPSGSTVLAAILVNINQEDEVTKVQGIFVYQGKQYNVPFKYFYDGNFVDTSEGIDSGIFLYPRVVSGDQGIGLDKNGALLYLSSRTVKSNLVRYYLYGEENEFVLTHNEPDIIVNDLNSQGAEVGDFVYYQGFRGPIKIWQINYPKDIIYRSEFLNVEYPEDLYLA